MKKEKEATPNNLEECFNALNSLLDKEYIEEIKDLDSRSRTIMYHHGLGTALRNNWGLWKGSNLQTYLTDRGIMHPDDMSSTILQFYYDWLNDDHTEWQKFDKNIMD